MASGRSGADDARRAATQPPSIGQVALPDAPTSRFLSVPVPARPASPEPKSGPNLTMPNVLPLRNLQKQYKKRAVEMPIKIFVTNWEMPEEHRSAREYHCGANELDTKKVYGRISMMRYHKQRGMVLMAKNRKGEEVYRLKQCTGEYLNDFFAYSCAYIIEYLLDFFPHDTAIGRRTWHILITRLQEAAAQLPHAFWDNDKPSCTHSKIFTEQYEATMSFINLALSGRPERITDNSIHYTRPMIDGHELRFGAYVNGLKPWENWMLNGSPGFSVGRSEGDEEADGELWHETELYQYEVREGQVTATRHVPMGALAIVQRHTERAREVAERVAEDLDTEQESVALMSEYDMNTLSLTQGNDYKSFTGHRTIARPMTFTTSNPSSAPNRVPGFTDPAIMLKEPKLWNMDEATGQPRAIKPVVHPGGDDDFQMMTVSTVGQRQEGEGRFGEMFEDWKIEQLPKRTK